MDTPWTRAAPCPWWHALLHALHPHAPLLAQLRPPASAGRMFWPREVWGRYAERLDAFKQPAQRHAAVRCLNALVANALAHAPHCLEYLAQLRNPAVFRFCAIPQAWAQSPQSVSC